MAVHARVGGAQGADGRGEGANPAPAPAFSSRRRRRLCGSARRRPPGSQLPPSLPAWPRGVGLFLWLPCRRVGGTQEYPGCRAVCIAGGSSLPLSGAACGWGGATGRTPLAPPALSAPRHRPPSFLPRHPHKHLGMPNMAALPCVPHTKHSHARPVPPLPPPPPTRVFPTSPPDCLPTATATNGAKWVAMRHGKKMPKLNRPANQRKALIRTLVTEVLRHGRITTTKVRGDEKGKRRGEKKNTDRGNVPDPPTSRISLPPSRTRTHTASPLLALSLSLFLPRPRPRPSVSTWTR